MLLSIRANPRQKIHENRSLGLAYRANIGMPRRFLVCLRFRIVGRIICHISNNFLTEYYAHKRISFIGYVTGRTVLSRGISVQGARL